MIILTAAQTLDTRTPSNKQHWMNWSQEAEESLLVEKRRVLWWGEEEEIVCRWRGAMIDWRKPTGPVQQASGGEFAGDFVAGSGGLLDGGHNEMGESSKILKEKLLLTNFFFLLLIKSLKRSNIGLHRRRCYKSSNKKNVAAFCSCICWSYQKIILFLLLLAWVYCVLYCVT